MDGWIFRCWELIGLKAQGRIIKYGNLNISFRKIVLKIILWVIMTPLFLFIGFMNETAHVRMFQHSTDIKWFHNSIIWIRAFLVVLKFFEIAMYWKKQIASLRFREQKYSKGPSRKNKENLFGIWKAYGEVILVSVNDVRNEKLLNTWELSKLCEEESFITFCS